MNTLEVMPDTTATQRSMKPAKTAPTLPKGNDAEVATELRRLVADAESGLRRILIAGFFIDRIVAELPKGQLKGWLEAHCPDVTQRTTNRWRELASNVAAACGIKMDTRVHFNLPALLAMPMEEVPEAQSEMRAQIDEMIDGKSFRQLVFAFKQAEEGPDGKTRSKAGRRKGEGGNSAEQRAAAAEVEEEARLEALKIRAADLATEMLELADDRNIGLLEDELHARIVQAHATLGDYLRDLRTRRTGR